MLNLTVFNEEETTHLISLEEESPSIFIAIFFFNGAIIFLN